MVEAAGRDHDEFRMPPGTRSADGGGAALVETPEGEPLQLEVALGGDPKEAAAAVPLASGRCEDALAFRL